MFRRLSMFPRLMLQTMCLAIACVTVCGCGKKAETTQTIVMRDRDPAMVASDVTIPVLVKDANGKMIPAQRKVLAGEFIIGDSSGMKALPATNASSTAATAGAVPDAKKP